jgi:hypothetical protein
MMMMINRTPRVVVAKDRKDKRTVLFRVLVDDDDDDDDGCAHQTSHAKKKKTRHQCVTLLDCVDISPHPEYNIRDTIAPPFLLQI